MRIAVIGAGIVGCATAHALLDDGHEVTLVDAREVADKAAGVPSAGNAGWIAHSDIVPLASAKSLKHLPRWLVDPLGPLAIRPAYLLKIAPWMIRFLLAARPAEVERSILALAALQTAAMPAWRALADRLDLGGMIHERGGLYVYDNRADFEAAGALARRQREFGIEIDMLGFEEMRRLEPALGPGFVGAGFVPKAAHIDDPAELTRALFEKALQRGARFERRAVDLVEPGEHPLIFGPEGWQMPAEAAVLSAGAWSRPLAAVLGDAVPLDTERGYNVSFPGATEILTRPVSFEGHGFVATPLASGLRIGGAVEFGGLDAAPNHARTRALHTKAARFLKGVPPYEAGVEWMGFRPSLPDSLPVIGPSRRSPRIIHAFGHGHFGMTQAAITGRLVADLLAGRKPALDPTPFSAQRF